MSSIHNCSQTQLDHTTDASVELIIPIPVARYLNHARVHDHAYFHIDNYDSDNNSYLHMCSYDSTRPLSQLLPFHVPFDDSQALKIFVTPEHLGHSSTNPFAIATPI